MPGASSWVAARSTMLTSRVSGVALDPTGSKELRARAEITSHFVAGPQARWRGASDELYPGRYVRSEQQSQRACGPQPEGARRQGRVSALLPLLDDVRHRLRRGASHLPARRSRQNVNLFLREPLVQHRLVSAGFNRDSHMAHRGERNLLWLLLAASLLFLLQLAWPFASSFVLASVMATVLHPA